MGRPNRHWPDQPKVAYRLIHFKCDHSVSWQQLLFFVILCHCLYRSVLGVENYVHWWQRLAKSLGPNHLFVKKKCSSLSEIEKAVDEPIIPKNTEKATAWAFRLFNQWLVEHNDVAGNALQISDNKRSWCPRLLAVLYLFLSLERPTEEIIYTNDVLKSMAFKNF